jgi:hypothetical protein
MSTPAPERRQRLCMATAEDRRVRLQSYADAKTLDRELRSHPGPRRRIAMLLDRLRLTVVGSRGPRREPQPHPPAHER